METFMEHTIVIKENHLFRRLDHRGKYQAHPLLVTYALKNRLPHNRYGITASKKIGGAVERNRAKRVIRAAYSKLEPEIPTGWDFIFVARTKTTLVKMDEVAAVMKRQMEHLVK